MSGKSVPVTVKIQDKEYRIGCPKGEEEALISTARYVDQKMQEVRSAGKVIGNDRIAVMAALNIAHELIQQSKESEYNDGSILKVRAMQERIQNALNSLKQMEL
ncbi:MAG: cell division protein ZapA [Gammaproteobacteria bacterium]|nr:cell division protein ZapA [Gammaproteobacteria bacterium]MCF6230760.1 cell division protein ZapA [Gammaproteobacteria bacterium]